ncbi:MAG TPA: hypothetical protein VGY31_03460 [Terriglobia bacterium]|nr:hypothetical protein [Terriglobia bacterium]
MGGFSVPSYADALGSLLNPFDGAAQASVWSDIGSWSSITDPFYNALGYVGPGQKSDLISSETSALTQAGTDATTAAATANSDVTNALTSSGFDPSQATGLNAFLNGLGTAGTYILVGAALIAMTWLLIEIVPIL